MSFKKNRGFTLIELLVVIAIIGILSSVVLASLNTSRNRGKDAAIKGTMKSIRIQSSLYYDDPSGGNRTYGMSGDCTGGMFADATIAAIIMEIDSVNGTGNVFCGSNDQEWAMSANLPTGTDWCVDYIGIAKEQITGNGDTFCP